MLDEYQNSAPSTPPVVNAWDTLDKDRYNKDSYLSMMSAAADAQNQLNMTKYNNEYNYWLWKMQTEYNSPSNQVQRLKDAGLNPNFNSIEGAGNASSPSPSNGSLKSNFLGAYQASISARAQRLNEINAIVSGFNDLVRNVGEGFDMYKTYVNTPLDASFYRSDLSSLLHNKASQASFDSAIKGMMYRVASGQSDEQELKSPFALSLLGRYGSDAWQAQLAEQKFMNLKADEDLKKVVKGLKEFEVHNLQPKQLELLEHQIDNLFSRTQFIDTQDSMYQKLKVGGMLLPFALMLFKSLM